MNLVEIIEKKKLKQELTKDEIQFFAETAARSKKADDQLAALLMAIRLNGMNPRETADLTLAMAESGAMPDLRAIPGKTVDKHSTGGVGDTTTLVLVPLVAACGVPVAKMSGRGLGHTGGTLDKLESIPGMKVALGSRAFINQVKKIGCAVIGQSTNIAPADKRLYALRDVTSTVDSLPLIASSIMSKKLASGAQGIVLDVKTGTGALMPTLEGSIDLAQAMVEIGRRSGRDTMALVTAMDEPLGSHVGNALEVKDAIDVLAGRTGGPLLEVSLILGAYMLMVAGKHETPDDARKALRNALDTGRGLEKLREMIAAQGGDSRVCDDVSLLPQAPVVRQCLSDRSGYVQAMNTTALGAAAQDMGAGRKIKSDVIDPAVGFVLHKRIGEQVKKGEALFTLHARDEASLEEAKQHILRSITIGAESVPTLPLIYAVIDTKGNVRKVAPGESL